MKKNKLLKLPYWIILIIILTTATIVVFVSNRDKEQHNSRLEQFLVYKGDTIIKSLENIEEAKRDPYWIKDNFEDFLNIIDSKLEIPFIIITDQEHNIISFAGNKQFININLPDFETDNNKQKADYNISQIKKIIYNDNSYYIVYKPFKPFIAAPKHMMHKKMQQNSFKDNCQMDPFTGKCQLNKNYNSEFKNQTNKKEIYIYVAINGKNLEQMAKKRIRNNLIFTSLFGLSIIVGLLALFNLYNSRINQKLYSYSHALASELMASLPLGLLIKNTKNIITTTNNEFMNISKLKKEEIINHSIENLFKSYFPTNETINGQELELAFKNDQKVSLAIYSAPILDSKKNKLGAIILLKNLNEVEELKKALAKEERLADLGRMAAGLAHEIRNPLGATRGLTQHLLSKAEDKSNEKEALEVMLISLDRLNQTISNFLEYAKPSEIKPKELELTELLQKLNSLISHDAQSSAVEINLKLPNKKVFLQADESRLAQALLNIYLNGIQASGLTENGLLNVSLEEKNNNVIITFNDNGPGFSKEQLAKPFVPYFTTKAEGSGLGLAMVEKIIKAHNGTITLNNNENGGGLVIISLNFFIN